VFLLTRPYKYESNSDSSLCHSASCFQIPPGLILKRRNNLRAVFYQ
jgi:hypothetical protein